MGCDGGTIPKRNELVAVKKKPVQEKDEKNAWFWSTCSLTQLPFEPPVASCFLGKFYNKCAVVDALLNKSPMLPQHIKRLKDIKDLQLTPNPAFKPSAEKGDVYADCHLAPYICPVVGIEMNGKFRFVFLWGCGCVMSERALKEVKSKLCLKCQQPFSEEDIVILNPTPEDLDLMRTRLETRQARVKAGKKAHNHAEYKGHANATVTSTETSSNRQDITKKLSDQSTRVHDGKEETSSFVSGEEERQKSKLQNGKSRPKLLLKHDDKLNGIKNALPTKRQMGHDIEDPLFKKTRRSYSVASDPKATDVFKSLFTSHQKAQQQTKAHWITYNPFYN